MKPGTGSYINGDAEKKGREDKDIDGGLEKAREKVNDVCKVKAAAVLSSTPRFPSSLYIKLAH